VLTWKRADREGEDSGVGPMTRAMLLTDIVEIAERHAWQTEPAGAGISGER